MGALLAVLALVLECSAASAAEQRPVDLQLVLAVDASGSVDATRFELQRRGYAAAFADPRILRAIRSGPHRAIAVTLFQWTGPLLQERIIDWTLVEDQSSAEALSAEIGEAPRRLFRGGTAVGAAIDYGAQLFALCPYPAPRRVIDVSGDGANNIGRAAAPARDAAVAAGITVNGLPILAIEPELDRYYRDNVIGGPGSFMIVAASFEHFAEAIREKLVAEIATASPHSDTLAAR
jgi:hypothetical protein